MAGKSYVQTERGTFTEDTGTLASVWVAQLKENPVGWLKPSEGEEDLSLDNKWRRREVCDRCFCHKPLSGACC
jgi:hypothetical protein